MKKIYSVEIVYPEDPFLETVAERLTKEFASYRIPASVVRKTGLKSLAEVTEPWLVVLCSPECPDCEEVRERIRAFSAEGRYHNVLSLLVKGRSGSCFPEELVYETRPDGTVVEHEPLAANIVANSERESLRLLPVEKLRLLAPILGVSFDELRNRRLMTRLRIAAALGTAVMLGAAAFFLYAFSRMTLISAQNKDLELQYAQAQEARDRAEEQRDAAREEFAGTTAIRARSVLDKGDSELAMLLCLEFLPEAGLTTELPGILDDALQGFCREGYVPVTSVREYGKDRYQPDPEKPASDTADGPFPEKITRPVPEEYDNGKDTFSLTLEVSSETQGYAVYSGSFNSSRTSVIDVYRTRVCFLNDPDQDYDLPFWTKASKWTTADLILPDGSFIGREYANADYHPCRYDPFAREFLPFYDEAADGGSGTPAEGAPEEGEILPGDPELCREAGIHVGEVPGTPAKEAKVFSPYSLDCDVERFAEIPGADGLVFGYTRTETSDYGLEKDDVKTYVFSKDPFRYLYTMEDVVGLFRPEGSKYIYGTTGKKLLIFSAEPFRYLYTLEDEFTASAAGYNYDIPCFPDGRSWLYAHISRKKAVFDLDSGRRLSAISDPGQSYSMEITSDGLILSSLRNVPTLWNPEDGSVCREIPGVEEDEPKLYGTYDEATGRRNADAIRVGSIVYEYRESAVPVPEDLPGKTELAVKLLGGRKLTKKERQTYDLELQDDPETPDGTDLPDVPALP